MCGHVVASGARAVSRMAPYSESASVFSARVTASGLFEADATALCAEVSNLKQLAFMSSYTPGWSDEKPLMDVFAKVLKRIPDIPTKACLRALWREAYAVSTVEMKQRVEQTEDSSTRKLLSQPDRSERFERQKKKLSSLTIRVSASHLRRCDRQVCCLLRGQRIEVHRLEILY